MDITQKSHGKRFYLTLVDGVMYYVVLGALSKGESGYALKVVVEVTEVVGHNVPYFSCFFLTQIKF